MNILSILWQSLTITLFVLSMMLIIDYLNVFSKGLWGDNIKKKPVTQLFIGALLGVIPGCLGAYTAVSLYVHNIIGRGALVATMIATSGDEAFFMFSIIPKTALILHLLLFVIALAAGFLVNHLSRKEQVLFPVKHFELHEDAHEKISFSKQQFLHQIKHITFTRIVLIAAFLVAMVLIGFNFNHLLEGFGSMDAGHEAHNHFHPRWISVTFLVVLSASLIVILTVSEHFLKEHLWNHIIRKHFLRILLWTFFTLLAIQIASQYVDIEDLIGRNTFIVLIIAILVGIIPESGPHFIFIILFASGNLPFSILLANSIVQDGHGSLPLLAESQKNFVIIKAINVAVGFIAGLIGIMAGF
jgi:hypothetical protein